ncbi:hypothetical protein BJ170DRAFT_593548 [Xylariales sp. AK1849]|nr:hypothetical protein BJ170DRAFT_593548 [Xylariales sp. AK1849]
MASKDLVRLNVSICGDNQQDLRLTYIGHTGTNDRAASLAHTHYSYMRRARRDLRHDIILRDRSITFKNVYASRVDLVNDRRYDVGIEDSGRAQELEEDLSLPGIRYIPGERSSYRQVGMAVIQFKNSFDHRSWNLAVSSIPPAQLSTSRAQVSAARRKKHNVKKSKTSKDKKMFNHSTCHGIFTIARNLDFYMYISRPLRQLTTYFNAVERIAVGSADRVLKNLTKRVDGITMSVLYEISDVSGEGGHFLT